MIRLVRLAFQTLILGTIFWFFAVGGMPGLVLLWQKDNIVASLERGGYDVSECKHRKLSALEPTAGIPTCFVSTFEDLKRRTDALVGRIEDTKARRPAKPHTHSDRN